MRLCVLWSWQIPKGFNPRICKRCDCNLPIHAAFHESFNPRICKRCDRVGVAVCLPFSVSIHASVKDATSACRCCKSDSGSFNPRICKRCDSRRACFSAFYGSFNPRICKRCDAAHMRGTFYCSGFNPRICKRCDLSCL